MRWVTSTSVSGRSTSSNTRCSGSANDVAVYCIRGVSSSAPQAHNGSVTESGRRRDRHPARPTAASTAAARAAVITPGAIEPCTPGSRSTAPKSVNAKSWEAGSSVSTRRNVGPTANGATATTTQAAAASAIPASMLTGASRASTAGSERGRARKPMPNAFTIAATPSPVVSATAPTASGAARATSVLCCGAAWISDWTSNHSLTKPAPSGNPDAPSAATPNSTVVAGIRRARPPSRSRSRSPVAASTDPAARNPRLLNAACATRCSIAAVIAIVAAECAPESANSVAPPRARMISPMFSVVE